MQDQLRSMGRRGERVSSKCRALPLISDGSVELCNHRPWEVFNYHSSKLLVMTETRRSMGTGG